MSLKVETFDIPEGPAIPQHTNYFSVFWVQEGAGMFCAESGQYPLPPNSLFFLAPYQSFRFDCETGVRGLCLQFHANFLCIETYHQEVGCNGVLFNDTYGVPCVNLEECHTRDAGLLLDEIRRELQERGLAHSEVLLSYLKIFLVRATRLKLQQQEVACVPQPDAGNVDESQAPHRRAFPNASCAGGLRRDLSHRPKVSGPARQNASE